MIFWQTLITSIRLPSKQAMFKLNRIGMDITVVYMFILLFLVSIPSLIERIITPQGIGSDMNLLFVVIYFFIFYYLPLVIIFFISLSIATYLFKGISKLVKRKLQFSLLWKMCAYATTIPLLLYIILSIKFHLNILYLWLSLLYTFILIIKMIFHYPKRSEKNKSIK